MSLQVHRVRSDADASTYPNPAPNNMDSRFRYGKILFDNEKGLGNTPMGQNIEYGGAVCWMRPRHFLDLAFPEDRMSDAKEILALMKEGQAIAAPFLQLDMEGEPASPGRVWVNDHEGRARTTACVLLQGQECVPVQMTFAGLRARHLSPEFFQWISDNGICSQARKNGPALRQSYSGWYWNGTKVKTTFGT
jgi:hypothetical protein